MTPLKMNEAESSSTHQGIALNSLTLLVALKAAFCGELGVNLPSVDDSISAKNSQTAIIQSESKLLNENWPNS